MKIIASVLGITVVLAAALAIPSAPDSIVGSDAGGAFTWAQDSLWFSLERDFISMRDRDCAELHELGSARIDQQEFFIGQVRGTHAVALDPILDSLEVGFFQLSPIVAACPDLIESFVAIYSEMRSTTKEISRGWDMTDPGVRDRIYRLLYGGRAAVEEVILQHPDEVPSLVQGRNEPSKTPSAMLHGVEIHSGDILVSRGGYPTSALIARGSDYPGNFSHIALVHVDGQTQAISTIESHIEAGVAVASASQYLEDKKLRILVLRPRADLPQLIADPTLPHRAAVAAITRARSEHVAYDFEMDYTDPERLFCSEVASSVYSDLGVDLWMGISRISSPGLRRWLSAFGVRHFETQEPSDLEYDPQLVVVAEWRDADALFKDHVDNAVTDAMLEGAERGDELEYTWYQLPPARVMKAYSWVLQQFGGVGPVPEGMSATAALRNRSYTERHGRLASHVFILARDFETSSGYVAPYWKLLAMAREAVLAEEDR